LFIPQYEAITTVSRQSKALNEAPAWCKRKINEVRSQPKPRTGGLRKKGTEYAPEVLKTMGAAAGK
jgi:hypothetical protein